VQSPKCSVNADYPCIPFNVKSDNLGGLKSAVRVRGISWTMSAILDRAVMNYL
jgi:hypothetical protein